MNEYNSNPLLPPLNRYIHWYDIHRMKELDQIISEEIIAVDYMDKVLTSYTELYWKWDPELNRENFAVGLN